MISVFYFKQKYPRQYKKLINRYGGRKNIFDVQAAINMYIRGDAPPTCGICGVLLTITKKFRTPCINLRCSKHSNTNKIISKEDLFNFKNAEYEIVHLPDKVLTRTDKIKVNCKKHGIYTVNLGNFIDGKKCQKCYHESMKGSTRAPHTEQTKKHLSLIKTGIPVNLSEKSKIKKTLKQKQAWERRKNDQETYKKYIDYLSKSRKEYIQQHGFCFPNREKTGLEIQFEQFLIKNKIEFIPQFLLDNKAFDFYIPSLSLLVEVDGEYWHRFASSIKNDKEKHRISIKNNIQLVRISSDNFCPEIIFEDQQTQEKHTNQILLKRGIHEF